MSAAAEHCCTEYGCRRRKPYKLRFTPFSKRWTLITDYTIKGRLLTASRKHDVHDEVVRALIGEGVIPNPAVLRRAADVLDGAVPDEKTDADHLLAVAQAIEEHGFVEAPGNERT